MLQERWFICAGERHRALIRHPEKGTGPRCARAGFPREAPGEQQRGAGGSSGEPPLPPWAPHALASEPPSLSFQHRAPLFPSPPPGPAPLQGAAPDRAFAPCPPAAPQRGSPWPCPAPPSAGRGTEGRGKPCPGRTRGGAALAAPVGPGRGSRRPSSRGGGAGGPGAGCSLSGQNQRRLAFPSPARALKPRGCSVCRCGCSGAVHPGEDEGRLGMPEVPAARSAWSHQPGRSAAAPCRAVIRVI